MPQRTKAPKRKGEDTRLAILRELRRREIALEPGPTTREMEQVIGLAHGTVFYHVRVLRNAGDLLPTRRLHLSETGRAKVDATT